MLERREQFTFIEGESISCATVYVTPATFWRKGKIGIRLALKNKSFIGDSIYIEDKTPVRSCLTRALDWVKKSVDDIYEG